MAMTVGIALQADVPKMPSSPEEQAQKLLDQNVQKLLDNSFLKAVKALNVDLVDYWLQKDTKLALAQDEKGRTAWMLLSCPRFPGRYDPRAKEVGRLIAQAYNLK